MIGGDTEDAGRNEFSHPRAPRAPNPDVSGAATRRKNQGVLHVVAGEIDIMVAEGSVRNTIRERRRRRHEGLESGTASVGFKGEGADFRHAPSYAVVVSSCCFCFCLLDRFEIVLVLPVVVSPLLLSLAAFAFVGTNNDGAGLHDCLPGNDRRWWEPLPRPLPVRSRSVDARAVLCDDSPGKILFRVLQRTIINVGRSSNPCRRLGLHR
mmetsp:Transcript_54125/g.162029  ORF Transcript_54125/g.162029 Transcript_54125/m.162029 type:complete len:209 (+) Transcript_54125:1414-2040(+)